MAVCTVLILWWMIIRKSMETLVYRYGHRLARDKRVTTHVALTARAFGARGIIVDKRDTSIENSVRKVVKRFGGSFFIESGIPWRDYFKQYHGTVVHLTMYGQEMDRAIKEIKTCDQILLVVGSEKVPSEFYELADYNVAVGNQPHSEVAALAVFLHELSEGLWKSKSFDGMLQVKPSRCGKCVLSDYLPILKQEGCSSEVINHSIKVQELAYAIAQHIASRGIKVDIESVEEGALLHDIGRARTHGIMHVIEGVAIAESYGLPKKIIAIIRNHAGAGISQNEAQQLGLPDGDYTPRTIEEMIVAHADNLTGHDYRTIDETTELFERKAGALAAEKVRHLHKTLSELAGIDLDFFVKKIKKS